MRRLLIPITSILFLIATCALADPPANRYDRSNAGGNQLILRVSPADTQPVADQYGLEVVGQSGAGGRSYGGGQGPRADDRGANQRSDRWRPEDREP